MTLTVLNVAYPFAPVGPDAVGGAEQVLSMIDAAITRAGHRSLVVACDGSRVAGELIATPRPPERITADSRRSVQQRHRETIEVVLHRNRVDVIHLHGIDFLEYLPESDVPILATLHLPPAWYSPDAFRTDRTRLFLHCVSKTQQEFCHEGTKLLPPIKNGVDVDRLRPARLKRNFAVALGRICPEKGFHIAIDAAKAAGIPLLLAGEVTHELPTFVRCALDDNLAQGTGWKFAPLRLFPDRFELSLDNDCILWEMPAAIDEWLRHDSTERCVIAEDVRRMLGMFGDVCGPEPRNSGIRGLPPGIDVDDQLRRLLANRGKLTSELDEQGLQVALVSQNSVPFVVTRDEVTICSPFPPLRPNLGRCGAHFVGLNARRLPWDYDGRPAHELVAEHWRRWRPELYERVGIHPVQNAAARAKVSEGAHR